MLSLESRKLYMYACVYLVLKLVGNAEYVYSDDPGDDTHVKKVGVVPAVFSDP